MPIDIKRLVPLISFVLALMGCGDSMDLGGGDPGGGTSLPTSTHDEIKRATWDARDFLLRNRMFWNLEKNFAWDSNSQTHTKIKEILFTMSSKDIKQTDGSLINPEDILKATPLTFSTKDCVGGPEHSIKDASVSKNSYEGSICLSLNRLSRFTSENLKENMIIILAHEYAHIFKYGETEADLISKFFTENIDTITKEEGHFLRQQVSKQFSKLSVFLNTQIIGLRTGKATKTEFLILMGKIGTAITTLDNLMPTPTTAPQMQLSLEKYRFTTFQFILITQQYNELKRTLDDHSLSETNWTDSKNAVLSAITNLHQSIFMLDRAVADYLGAPGPGMKPYQLRANGQFEIEEHLNESIPDGSIHPIEQRPASFW